MIGCLSNIPISVGSCHYIKEQSVAGSEEGETRNYNLDNLAYTKC